MQATPPKPLLAAPAGTGTSRRVQAFPFHVSASGTYAPLEIAVPTATHADAEGHETSARSLAPETGAGLSILHAVPFQPSISSDPELTFVREYPAATHATADTQDRPFNWLYVAPAGLGVLWSFQGVDTSTAGCRRRGAAPEVDPSTPTPPTRTTSAEALTAKRRGCRPDRTTLCSLARCTRQVPSRFPPQCPEIRPRLRTSQRERSPNAKPAVGAAHARTGSTPSADARASIWASRNLRATGALETTSKPWNAPSTTSVVHTTPAARSASA